MKDYYQILEVATDASQDIIKEQYRFLVQAWHPDKFPNPAQKLRAEEKLKEINAAYEILRNPAKRSEYDNSRSRYTHSKYEQEYRERTNQHQSEDEQRNKEEATHHAERKSEIENIERLIIDLKSRNYDTRMIAATKLGEITINDDSVIDRVIQILNDFDMTERNVIPALRAEASIRILTERKASKGKR
jgi:curved DNA-binding protein CbpA